MKKVLCALLLSSVCISLPTLAFADAQTCIDGALQAAKANVKNQRVLGALFDTYFGEAFARFPVRREWDGMSQSDHNDQIAYARNVVVSEASQLAEFADANIKFVADITDSHIIHGYMKNGKSSRKITVFMGSGCHFVDIEVEGYPKLSSTISDVRKLVRK